MNPVWARALGTLAFVAVSALIAWPLFGATAALGILAVGLALLLMHHLRNLAVLARWLRAPPEAPVPAGSGVWEYVFAALHRLAGQRALQQQALAAALQRFRDAGEALPDGVVMLDSGNHIEWSNSKAQAHFGLDARRDVGQPLLNFIRQPEFVAYLAQAQFNDGVIVETKHGAGLVLSIQVIPYGEEQKLLLSRDITELDRVATVRRDFVANVSHELKTPLTVVAGFLETIQDLRPGPVETARYLKLMSEQTRSMQRLIEDLLVLSALESAENVLREEAVDVHPLLESLYAEAQILSGVQYDITLEIACEAVLLGAESELRSAFSNLITNAVRYTPPGGAIRLRWEVLGDEPVFSVIDSGIGIDHRHIPRLTERFYRVDRSRSRATGGTGLGLAIVKHVLIRHQASLKIASEPGQGSCFSVCFPARRLVSQRPARMTVQLAASR